MKRLKWWWRLDNHWQDFRKNWKLRFEASLWRSEPNNYLNVGPELWFGSLLLFGLSYGRCQVIVFDSHHFSFTLVGFGFGIGWEQTP